MVDSKRRVKYSDLGVCQHGNMNYDCPRCGLLEERERSSQLSQELQRVSEELDAALERLAQIERLA